MPQSRFKSRVDYLSDQYAFFIALFVGALIIAIFRWLTTFSPPGVVAIILIIIIALYTCYVIYYTSGRSGISLDRAGDNAYYLGLLFTLITLIFSLLKMRFHDSTFADDLLYDFGIALISTIAGIIARAWIQHSHNDPTDIETQAAHDLNRASEELRASLSTVIFNVEQASLKAVSAMNRTSQATDVAVQEMLNHTRKTLEESAKANAELFSSLSHKIDETVHDFLDQTNLASEGMKEFANTTNVAISHISLAEKNFKELSVDIEQTRQTIEIAKNQYQDFSSAIANFANKFSQLIPEDFLQQFRSTRDEVLKQQKQLLFQLNTQEQDAMRFKEQLSNAGGRVSGVAEELEKGLAYQFESTREKAGQLEQGLSRINNKVQNITKDIEQEETVIMSQLKEVGDQLMDKQKKLLPEFESLHRKISQAEENVATIHMEKHIAKIEDRTSIAEKDFKNLSVDIEQARQTMETAKSQYQDFSSVMAGVTDKFSQLIPEDLLQQFRSTQNKMLEQQKQFQEQLSNAGGRASGVAEELEKGLVSQFEIIREKAGQLEQGLSRINNKVQNITKGIEQEKTTIISQLKEVGDQLMGERQKLPLAFESLHKKIQQTKDAYKPSTSVLQGQRRDNNIQQTKDAYKPSTSVLQGQRRDNNIQQTKDAYKPSTSVLQDKKRDKRRFDVRKGIKKIRSLLLYRDQK